MTPAEPLDCVVDASVGIKLFVAESLSDAAQALFACGPALERMKALHC